MADVIEYQKCWLCINPIMGCPLNCKYCILSNRDFGPVETKSTAEGAVRLLLNNKYFVADITPITVHNYSDPFLKQTRTTTLDVLEILDNAGLRNPVSVITKCEIKDPDVTRLTSLKNIKLFVFVSLSGLSKNIEPAPDIWKLKTMERIAATSIPLVHYWRPLMRGYNTDTKTLLQVISLASKFTSISVTSGLKLSAPVQASLESIIDIPDEEWHPDCKVVRSSVFDEIRNIAEDVCPDHIFFRKTSCAVSYVLGESDYNGNIVNATEYGCKKCPNYTRCSQHNVSEGDVRLTTDRFGVANPFSVHKSQIKFTGSLTLDQRTALRHCLRIRIDSDQTIFPEHFRGEKVPLDADHKPKT